MKNDIKDGFLTDTSRKENAYLLGLLWADGWIINEGYMHSVRLQMVKDDFLLIEPLFRMMVRVIFHGVQQEPLRQSLRLHRSLAEANSPAIGRHKHKLHWPAPTHIDAADLRARRVS